MARVSRPLQSLRQTIRRSLGLCHAYRWRLARAARACKAEGAREREIAAEAARVTALETFREDLTIPDRTTCPTLISVPRNIQQLIGEDIVTDKQQAHASHGASRIEPSQSSSSDDQHCAVERATATNQTAPISRINYTRATIMSRREVFNKATSIPVTMDAVVTQSTSAPPEVDLDNDLLQLVHQWRVAETECKRVGDILSASEDKVDAVGRPSPPEALFRRGTDFNLFWGFTGGKHHSGRDWYGFDKALEYLKQYRAPSHMGKAHARSVKVRIDEILEASAEWQKRIDALHALCGFTEANRLHDQHVEIVRELRREIVGIPARTFGGVLAKAEVILDCYGRDIDEMSDVLEDELKRGGPTAETIGWSLAVDMARLVKKRTEQSVDV